MAVRRLPLWLGVFIPGLCLYGLGSTGPIAHTAEPEPKPLDAPAAFLAQHCKQCHSGDKPKGKFRIDSLTQDFSEKANRDRWLTALEQVKSGNMPPKEKPRPAEKDVAALVEWINGRVAAAEVARNHAQGRVPLRARWQGARPHAVLWWQVDWHTSGS